MREFRVCVDGEPFEKHINGVFNNPEQTVKVTRVLTGEMMAVEMGSAVTKDMMATMAVVTVAETEDRKPVSVGWTDKHGGTHTALLMGGEKLLIHKKFLV